MTDPGFRVDSVQHGIPFRPRRAFAGYQVFGAKDSAVLVEPGTARVLRAAAAEAAAAQPGPRETGGLLSGRLLRDGEGSYVLVCGLAEAAPSSGRTAAFEMSPPATAQLREECARAQPTADVVGWWHSHFGPSRYSPTDLATQSVWKQPQSVGLLVFAAGQPWATAYLGPDAKHLGDPAKPLGACPAGRPGRVYPPADDRAGTGGQPDRPAGPPGPLADQLDAAPSQPGPGGVLTITGPPWQQLRSGPTARQRGLIRLAVIIFMLAAVVLLGALYSLSTQIKSGQQTLSSQLSSGERRLAGQIRTGQSTAGSQLRGGHTGSGAPAISEACVPAMPSATTGVYRCTAKTAGASGTIEWRLDGTPQGTGPSAAIRIPRDGHTHEILALLRTPTGTYPGVAADVSLPPVRGQRQPSRRR